MTQPLPERITCRDGAVHQQQAVIDAALHAYIAIDSQGRVVGWNPAAEDTFGFTHLQACGRTVADLIIPARYHDAHRAGLARMCAGEPGRVLGQRLQLFAKHADGHEFPIEMTLTATSERGGPVFHAFAHDITNAQRASRFSAVESAVARGLAEAESSTAAAARVVEALGVRMGWPVVEAWLVDDERQVLTCAARHIDTGRNLRDFALNELELGVGLPGRVCAGAAAHWIPDLAADTGSPRSRAAAHIGLRVAIGVPLSTGRHTLGALCVYGDRVEDPEDTLVGLLGGLAAQVGQYLQRRRAEELTVELARTKEEFLTLVTHELRNPLAAIVSTTALFDDELDELSGEQQRHYLHVISRNAQRLSAMTDDLLDLAQLESGHLAVDPTDTDLCVLIDQAVQAHSAAAADKQITLAVRMPERLDLYADPSRLRQVADNLLSNAIKYTPAGGTITITITDDTGHRVIWTVADTGIGIPPAEQQRLFRRFYRASTALDRGIPGIGLGLVITRTIIERHHGTIDLARHTGPGTTFTIELPVKPH